jgi:hypothetical protein
MMRTRRISESVHLSMYHRMIKSRAENNVLFPIQEVTSLELPFLRDKRDKSCFAAWMPRRKGAS